MRAQSLDISEVSTLGKTGEPLLQHYNQIGKLCCKKQGQRVRNTCLLERDPVKVKRVQRATQRKSKGPKSVLLTNNTAHSRTRRGRRPTSRFCSPNRKIRKTDHFCVLRRRRSTSKIPRHTATKFSGNVSRDSTTSCEAITQYLDQTNNLLLWLQLIKRRRHNLVPVGILSRLMKDKNFWVLASILGKTKCPISLIGSFKKALRVLTCLTKKKNRRNNVPLARFVRALGRRNAASQRLPRFFLDSSCRSWKKYLRNALRLIVTNKKRCNLSTQKEPVLLCINRAEETILRIFLELIYEPQFFSSNHGFRSGKSQHSCLLEIKQKFQGAKHVIIGKTSNSSTGSLLTQSYESIKFFVKDRKFLDLIRAIDVSNSNDNLKRFSMFSKIHSKYNVETPSKLFDNSLLAEEVVPDFGRLRGIKTSKCICPSKSQNQNMIELTDFLSNITLHKLDAFVLRLSRILHCDQKRFPRSILSDRSTVTFVRHSLNHISRHKSLSVDPVIPSRLLLHVNYIRYSNSFLLGISGPSASHRIAIKICRLVKRFLEVKLKMDLKHNTIVLKPGNEKIPFLGYLIDFAYKSSPGRCKAWSSLNRGSTGSATALVRSESLCEAQAPSTISSGKPRLRSRPTRRGSQRGKKQTFFFHSQRRKAFQNKELRRINRFMECYKPIKSAVVSNRTTKIRLLVNIQKVLDILSVEGFCDRSGKPKPNFRYFQNSQNRTVACVASLLRGLTNYYQLAENKRRCISRLSYILTNSVAMMFAAKYKLGTRAKVFAHAGRNLLKPLLSKKRDCK